MRVDHRTPRRSRLAPRLLAVAIPLAGLLAACTAAGASPPGSGGPVPSGPPPSSGPSDGSGGSGTAISHPTGPTDLVIRYEEVGGFVAPQALLTRYPVVSVYGDGRVINEGPIPAIYPGPAMPNLQVATVTEAGLQRLLTRARDDGLFGPDASYDATNVADASTARFTVVADGATHRIGAYGLGMDDAGADPAVAAARVKLRDFAAALGDLPASVGAENVGRGSGFAWDTLAIWVRPGAPEPSDPMLARPPIAWPLSAPLATFGAAAPSAGEGARCGTVSGADAATIRSLLDRATEITGWTSGGATYALTFHPLLPDQSDCPTGS
jgi:hypothetical protein